MRTLAFTALTTVATLWAGSVRAEAGAQPGALPGAQAGADTLEMTARGLAVQGGLGQAKLRPGSLGQARGEGERMGFPVARVEPLDRGDRWVRFGVTRDGIPALGLGALVRQDAQGRVLSAAGFERRIFREVSGALVEQSQAAQVAKKALAFDADVGHGTLVWRPYRGEWRKAWAFAPGLMAGPERAPRVDIDAETGQLLAVEETACSAVQARVYDTNPVVSKLAFRPLPIAPTGPLASLSNPFVNALNCVAPSGYAPLVPSNASAVNISCALQSTAKANANGEYDFSPVYEADAEDRSSNADDYSEVSMYFHVSKAYEYFRKLQGAPKAQVVDELPLLAISNVRAQGTDESGRGTRVPLNSAFYAPANGGVGEILKATFGLASGGLWFGQGPYRDYSYDGDVIYHEFTHAVVNATLKLGKWAADDYGYSKMPGALNEALADYFSSAIAGDPLLGEYAAKNLGLADAVRRLDNPDTCDAMLLAAEHSDSLRMSGMLWEARQSLGQEEERFRFDRAIYQSMWTSVPRPDMDFQSAVSLFRTTLEATFPNGAEAFRNAAARRGFLPSCRRIVTYGGQALVPDKGEVVAFAVPGIRVAGEVGRSSASDQGLLPGTLQVRYDLPPGAAEVAVTMAVVPSAIDTSAMQPFKPMLVAKFGERIRWSTSGPLKHDGDVVAPLVVEGTVGKATMAVPKGATFLVLQVANGGGADGAFRNLSITAANAAPAQELVQGTEPESGGLFGVRCSTGAVPKPLPPSLFAVALAMVQGAALRRRGRHRSASSPTASNQTASKSTLSKSTLSKSNR